MKTTNEGAFTEHVFMALTNVKAGRENDFHDWYDTEHVPDVVAVSSYQSARRFRLVAAVGDSGPWRYLSLYRFLGSVPAMHDELAEHGGQGQATLTDALVDDDAAWIYSPVRTLPDSGTRSPIEGDG
jgi:hypothetical protein